MTDQYWKTKKGKVIRITDMEDSHLLNTIAFIKRTNFTVPIGGGCEPEDYWYDEIDVTPPQLSVMEDEVESRGLEHR